MHKWSFYWEISSVHARCALCAVSVSSKGLASHVGWKWEQKYWSLEGYFGEGLFYDCPVPVVFPKPSVVSHCKQVTELYGPFGLTLFLLLDHWKEIVSVVVNFQECNLA